MLVDAQYREVGRFQGMEYDQSDTPAATYLVWPDTGDGGRASGGNLGRLYSDQSRRTNWGSYYFCDYKRRHSKRHADGHTVSTGC